MQIPGSLPQTCLISIFGTQAQECVFYFNMFLGWFLDNQNFRLTALGTPRKPRQGSPTCLGVNQHLTVPGSSRAGAGRGLFFTTPFAPTPPASIVTRIKSKMGLNEHVLFEKCRLEIPDQQWVIS